MTMLFKMKNICFLSMLIASFSNRAVSAACTTSEGQSGTCVALPQCKQALDIIDKYGISSKQAQTFLKSNHCGFEGFDQKVCCSQNTEQPTLPPPTTDNPQTLLPSDCGYDESDRIIGGNETELGQFPWMALLEYRQAGKTATALACGGTLISKRYVLTAAHCIRSIPSHMTLTNVRLGEHDVSTNPDCRKGSCADRMLSVPVERVIIHESYHVPQTHRNDIALLRLAHDVKFTRYVKPICLPTSAEVSSHYWAAGWGAIETSQSSDVKLKVNLQYFDADKCASKYRTKNVVLGAGQICAGGKAGTDTYKGDSGGPLMKQASAASGKNLWFIDGVVSIGYSPCGLEGWPAVYSKVYDYVDWIVEHLEP